MITNKERMLYPDRYRRPKDVLAFFRNECRCLTGSIKLSRCQFEILINAYRLCTIDLLLNEFMFLLAKSTFKSF